MQCWINGPATVGIDDTTRCLSFWTASGEPAFSPRRRLYAGGHHSIIPFSGQIRTPQKTYIFPVDCRNYETAAELIIFAWRKKADCFDHTQTGKWTTKIKMTVHSEIRCGCGRCGRSRYLFGLTHGNRAVLTASAPCLARNNCTSDCRCKSSTGIWLRRFRPIRNFVLPDDRPGKKGSRMGTRPAMNRAFFMIRHRIHF